MLKHTLLTTLGILALSGCMSHIPGEAYQNRGEPESLLDISSEVVAIPLFDDASLDELAAWVDQDQPSRAEIACPDENNLCLAAMDMLDQFGVDADFVMSDRFEVTLIYERILARDCENSYLTNHINPYNLNHPTFGCSTAANMVQMVADRRQFVNPALVSPLPADKLMQAADNYYEPPDLDQAMRGNLLNFSQPGSGSVGNQ